MTKSSVRAAAILNEQDQEYIHLVWIQLKELYNYVAEYESHIV